MLQDGPSRARRIKLLKRRRQTAQPEAAGCSEADFWSKERDQPEPRAGPGPGPGSGQAREFKSNWSNPSPSGARSHSIDPSHSGIPSHSCERSPSGDRSHFGDRSHYGDPSHFCDPSHLGGLAGTACPPRRTGGDGAAVRPTGAAADRRHGGMAALRTGSLSQRLLPSFEGWGGG